MTIGIYGGESRARWGAACSTAATGSAVRPAHLANGSITDSSGAIALATKT